VRNLSSDRTSRSHSFTGQKARLLYPSGELSFVERIALMDVEGARVLVLGRSQRDRTQRRAAEESHFDVVREAPLRYNVTPTRFIPLPVLLPNCPPHLEFSPVRDFAYNDVTLRVDCNTMRVC
jgi:hypothetical protein